MHAWRVSPVPAAYANEQWWVGATWLPASFITSNSPIFIHRNMFSHVLFRSTYRTLLSGRSKQVGLFSL